MAVSRWILQGLGLTASLAYHEYVVDTTWKPDFPKGSGIFSAVAVSGDKVIVDQRDAAAANPITVMDRNGSFLYSFGGQEIGRAANASKCNTRPTCFGSHGLAVQPADPSVGRHEDTIWVMDFFNNTVLSFNLKGELLGKAGRSGIASADMDKFDHVADATFRHSGSEAFFADGDGGINNRVERWSVASGKPESVNWVSPKTPPQDRKHEEFMNPHGICWHESTDRLLVADREHGRIAVMNPDSGVVEGNFSCDALHLGLKGKPFGCRTLRTPTSDLLFVPVSNNPADGGNQFVHVIDMSQAAKGSGVTCTKVLQSVAFAGPHQVPKEGEVVCAEPHLMGVDHQTGDLYLACVAVPGSNLVRLVQRAPASERSILV